MRILGMVNVCRGKFLGAKTYDRTVSPNKSSNWTSITETFKRGIFNWQTVSQVTLDGMSSKWSCFVLQTKPE